MGKRFITPRRSIASKPGCELPSRPGDTAGHDRNRENGSELPSPPGVPGLDHQLRRQQEPLAGLWKAWSQTLEQWRRHPGLGLGERGCREAAHLKLLSPRERQVLDWMESGKSVDETAVILGISPRTVEKHRQNLRAKLRPVEESRHP